MSTEIKTQTAGNMWKVLVKPGDHVESGQTLFIMEVMKMEVNHDAPVAGTVSAVYVEEGQEGLDGDVTAVVID